MALSTEPAERRFRYADLAAFPHDNVIREIIDGELIVTPAPTTRHQRAVTNFILRFGAYRNSHGGDAFAAPTGVFLADDNVVEPDLVFVRDDHLDRVELAFVNGPPDLVVEISSPSTRRMDIVRKRELYARFEIPEYWFVDFDAERVEIYRLAGGTYGPPELVCSPGTLSTPQLPGLEVSIDEALGIAQRPPPPDDS
ncbi:MAG: Uma2 family endonuclease [Actinomycetota bacterium]